MTDGWDGQYAADEAELDRLMLNREEIPADYPNAITRRYKSLGLPATMAGEQRKAWDDFLANRGAPVRLLPKNGDNCRAATHAPLPCGRPLLIDGSCYGDSDHLSEDEQAEEVVTNIDEMLQAAGNPAAQALAAMRERVLGKAVPGEAPETPFMTELRRINQGPLSASVRAKLEHPAYRLARSQKGISAQLLEAVMGVLDYADQIVTDAIDTPFEETTKTLSEEIISRIDNALEA